MSPASDAEFKEALRQLHRVKDAAYRDAWKKRGEVMSVMANIARKVDRLEYAVDGAPATDDESHLDTVIDLLVYTLKYQTYLADQDALIARELFEDSGVTRPYSDGTAGFDALITRLDIAPMEHHVSQGTAETTRAVLNAFAELEACFRGTPAPVTLRAAKGADLMAATVVLVGSLTRQAPERYRDFLFTYAKEAGRCVPRTAPSSSKT